MIRKTEYLAYFRSIFLSVLQRAVAYRYIAREIQPHCSSSSTSDCSWCVHALQSTSHMTWGLYMNWGLCSAAQIKIQSLTSSASVLNKKAQTFISCLSSKAERDDNQVLFVTWDNQVVTIFDSAREIDPESESYLDGQQKQMDLSFEPKRGRPALARYVPSYFIHTDHIIWRHHYNNCCKVQDL